MTITYPECQIEMEVDEAIELLDYFERKEPKTEIRQDFGHLKIPQGIPCPFEISEEVKIEINELMQKHLQESKLQLLRQTDPTRSGEGIEPLITKSPAPEFEPGGFVPENPDEGCLVKGETVKKGASMPKPVKDAIEDKQPRKVDVLFDDYGWKTFNSVSEAAKAIDARLNHFNHALLNNKTCNGHHVRYHATEPAPGTELSPAKHPAYSARKVDVQAEDGSWSTFDTVTLAAFHLGVTAPTVSLACRKERKVKGHAVRYHDDTDDIMAEIEASNKKPYQTTPPVR